MKKLLIGATLAFVLWFIMFSPWTAQKVNFWAVMFVSGLLLTSYVYLQDKKDFPRLFTFEPKHILIGIISAIILYFVFYFGKIISFALFDFSAPQVASVYSTKTGTPTWLISILLLFFIGPAEEIFWRGFILQEFMQRFNSRAYALILSTILYTLVHIWAFNLMLLVAAFVCGIFWGFIYLRYKSLVPAIISHSLWDFAVFIVFPFS